MALLEQHTAAVVELGGLHSVAEAAWAALVAQSESSGVLAGFTQAPTPEIFKVKDWAVSFIAAVLVVGLTVWCVRVFIEVMYG